MSEERPDSKRRFIRWGALVFAWLIVPCMLIGALELGLRAIGYGHSTRPFLKQSYQNKVLFLPNRDYYQQFYTMPIVWGPHEVAIAVPKPDKVYRIFVFGSSAAEGVPDPDFSFSRFIEVMLTARYPGVRFEVINLAMSGANSHIMRGAAQACAKCQPNLFVVYMGNNERNGFTAQKIFFDRGPWSMGLPFIHANILLTDLRLVQLFRHPSPSTNELERENHVVFSPEVENVYTYFRSNLIDICDAGTRAGAQVMLCTLGAKLQDWFGESKHHRELSAGDLHVWESSFADGVALQDTRNFQGAIPFYEKAAAIDNTYTELQERLGRCYCATGQYDKARVALEEACEWDIAHTRPTKRINAIIEETAARHAQRGVTLAPSARAFAEKSPHGIMGSEFFRDFVHLTFEGNYVLASSVFEQVQGLLPDWVKSHAEGPAEPLSRDECATRLGFTLPVLRDQLKRSYVTLVEFYHQPHEDLDKRLAELDRQIGPNELTLRAEGLRRALELNSEDYTVRLLYMRNLIQQGDNATALEQARILAAQFPYDHRAHGYLANLLCVNGNREAAISDTETLLEIYPDDSDARASLGRLLRDTGRLPESIKTYRQAVALRRDANTLNGLGNALEVSGDPNGALAAFREAVRIDKATPAQSDPGRAARQADLARALTKQGDSRGAIEAFRAAVELNKSDSVIRQQLIEALCAQDDYAAAAKEVEDCLNNGVSLPMPIIERAKKIEGGMR